MSRLEPVASRKLDPIRRLIDGTAKRLYGRPLGPGQVIAHHRPLLLGNAAIAIAHERCSRAVAPRLKELAMLRTAQLIGCEWCLDFGSYLAQRSGMPADDLRDLSRWPESDRFDRLDRLVLEYAEAMTRTPVEVPEPLFAQLREHLDPRQIVELTLSISLENHYSRANWALGIESEGFAEGMYCVRPQQQPATLVGDAAPR